MKKFNLKKVLFWLGLVGCVIGAFTSCTPGNMLSGIGLSISALGFLKASDMMKDDVVVEVPVAMFAEK